MIDPKYTTKLHPDTAYSFSYNPSNNYQYFQPPNAMVSQEIRLTEYKKYHQKALQFLQDNEIEYFMNLECSEPIKGENLSPRLHGHGFIYFNNTKAVRWFLLYGIQYLTKIASIEIDTIENVTAWVTYCNKQNWLGLGILTNQLMCTKIEEYACVPSANVSGAKAERVRSTN